MLAMHPHFYAFVKHVLDLSVCRFVCMTVKTIFWKINSMQMDRKGPTAKLGNDQLGGSEGQRSRLQEAEVRSVGLAEASFSTPLSRAAFLVEV